MKKILSLIFPISLLLIICIIYFFKNPLYSFIQHASIFLYLLWILFELIVSKRDFTEKNKTKDYCTKEIYATFQGLTIISALYFFNINSQIMFQILGISILIFGLFVRIYSVSFLGKYYSHNVRLLENHSIITSGPYSIIRHPAYSGMFIIHIGTTIIFWNFISFTIFLLLLIPAILIRIHIEEKVLNSLPKYKNYSKNKKRLIPYIW